MASVFLSYSHADETLKSELEKHLAQLRREGAIEVWHDRKISAGDALDKTISANLERAEIILLLVSSDFLNSNYCYDVEFKRALQKHEEGSARLIPIILRPCDWQHSPLGKLLAAPKDGKPITKWANLDEAFLDVVLQIRAVLPTKNTVTKTVSTTPVQIKSSALRSSNLRVKKDFTEADKDRFRDETFDFISNYFEGSLKELGERNPEIEGRFKRIDVQTFSAVIYKNGKAVAKCSVRNGSSRSFGFGSGITYSTDESGRGNSMNENLTIETGDQSLSLKAMMSGFMHGRSQSTQLTAEGAAEYYWGMLMEPLQ